MKNHIRTSLLMLVAVMALAVVPSAGRADTLADALASAYKHSGAIEQNRALLRVADEEVAVAVAALRPVISWSAGIQNTFGETGTAIGTIDINTWQTSLSLSARLVLYDGGARRFSVEAAKESVLAARQTLISAEQTVLFAAAEAYMNVRRDTEFVALRQNNVRVITQELRAAQDRFEVGEVTRTDVELAKARLAAARSQLAAAEGALMRSKETYRASVGHRPGTLSARVVLPRLPATVAEAEAIAVRQHPDLKRISHQIAASELLIKRAEAAMSPTVNLSGSLSTTETLNSGNYTNSATVGVNVTGPIYQGGGLSALLRGQINTRDSIRASQHTARHLIRQNVGFAWSFLAVARASREASDRQIEAARVAFRGVREEATLGARTTLDVLDAEQELLNAEANRISAIADEYTAAYRLLQAMGLLTAERLKLRVPHYDPAAYYNMVKTAPAIRSQQGQKLDKVLRALGKDY